MAQTADIIALRPVTQATLDQLVKSIVHHVYVARDAEGKMGRSRLKAGREMLLLRQRVESGDPEADGLTWWKYYARDLRAHFRSRKDAEKIMAIAAADDPDAALAEARASNAEQQRQSRKRKAADKSAGTTTADVSGNSEATEDENATKPVDDLIDRALTLVAEMPDATRRKFLAILERTYR